MGWYDTVFLRCNNWLLNPQFLSLKLSLGSLKIRLKLTFYLRSSSSSSPLLTSSCKVLGVSTAGFALNYIKTPDNYRRRWLFQWKSLDIIHKVNKPTFGPDPTPNAQIPLWNSSAGLGITEPGDREPEKIKIPSKNYPLRHFSVKW